MSSLFRVLHVAKHLWVYYVIVAVSSLLLAATTLATPFLISAAVAEVERAVRGDNENTVRTVVWLAVGLFAAQLVAAIVQNVGGYFGDVMSARMRVTLSTRYYDKLLRLPQRYYNDNRTGEITSKLNRSISELTQFIQSAANTFLPMILTTVVVLGITAYYSLWLAMLLFVLFPTYLWLTALTSRNWLEYEHDKNDNIDLASGRFQEVIAQVPVVRSFVAERRELHYFESHFAKTVGATRHQSRHWHRMDTLRRAVLAAVFFGIYLLLFVNTANGTYSLAVMVLLIQLVARVQSPVEMMSWVVDMTQRAMAGSKSYFDVLDTAEGRDGESIDIGDANEQARRITEQAAPDVPAIEFSAVSFEYEPGRPVVRDVSFTIHRGERLALVSESGGGKSTLVALLLGLHLPTAGTIHLFGHNAAELPMPVRRTLVGVVFQEPHLFSGTIAENITYARPDVGDDVMRDCARKAYADSFIEEFDEGYDTVIGERGLKLSGGQKQRVSVARAMVKDAPLLVLDEATSALDTKAERFVQQGLDTLSQDRTSLVIAHRLSTISSVDTIVTLSRGEVIEVGSPAELAASGGIYAELLSLQASASAADRNRLKKYGIAG